MFIALVDLMSGYFECFEDWQFIWVLGVCACL